MAIKNLQAFQEKIKDYKGDKDPLSAQELNEVSESWQVILDVYVVTKDYSNEAIARKISKLKVDKWDPEKRPVGFATTYSKCKDWERDTRKMIDDWFKPPLESNVALGKN